MWEYNNNELYHHGIKGMKWGVRRSRAQLGYSSSPRKTKKQAQKVSSKQQRKVSSKQQRKEAIKKMSDAELRSRINRIQMERQYMQLTAAEMSPGKKFVKDVVMNAAKQTATNYVAKFMQSGINYMDNQIKGNKL